MKTLKENFVNLQMKDFLNFVEPRFVEYDGKTYNPKLMYLDNKVVSRLADNSIKLLIDALHLNPYELVISFDIAEDG